MRMVKVKQESGTHSVYRVAYYDRQEGEVELSFFARDELEAYGKFAQHIKRFKRNTITEVLAND